MIKKVFLVLSVCAVLIEQSHCCSESSYSGWHTGLGIGYKKIKNDKKNENSKNYNTDKLGGSILLNPYFGYIFRFFRLNRFLLGADVGLTYTPSTKIKYQYSDAAEKSTKLKSNFGGNATLKLGMEIGTFDIYGLAVFSAERWIYDKPNENANPNGKADNVKKKLKFPYPSFGIGLNKVCCDHVAIGLDFIYGNKTFHKREDLAAENTPLINNKLETKSYTIGAHLEFKF